jgi:hypothetical protein
VGFGTGHPLQIVSERSMEGVGRRKDKFMTIHAKLPFLLAAVGLVFGVCCLSLGSSTTSSPRMAFHEVFQKPRWTFLEARNGQESVKFETQVNAGLQLKVTVAELTMVRSDSDGSNKKNCTALAHVEGILSGLQAITKGEQQGQVVRLVGRTNAAFDRSASLSNMMATERRSDRFQGGPWLVRPNTRVVSMSAQRPCSI